jgi:transposase-like protein
MKATLSKIRGRRFFSEDFKKKLVKEFETGKFSVLQLEKYYHVSNKSIYDWIYKYSTFNDKSIHVVEMKESNTNHLKELETRVKELERVVGVKQLHIDYLEKMIDIAKDDLGVDIKKNFNTPQSAISGKTKKK